jgi:hypothetical protein
VGLTSTKYESQPPRRKPDGTWTDLAYAVGRSSTFDLRPASGDGQVRKPLPASTRRVASGLPRMVQFSRPSTLLGLASSLAQLSYRRAVAGLQPRPRLVDSKSGRPCPEACPEPGISERTEPRSGQRIEHKALQIRHFKTGRAWQPLAWKVRSLRASSTFAKHPELPPRRWGPFQSRRGLMKTGLFIGVDGR